MSDRSSEIIGADIIEQRRATHGDPLENMDLVATRWTMILRERAHGPGFVITGEDVAECMAALHDVRRQQAPKWDPAHRAHADGYRQIAAMFRKRKRDHGS